MSCETGFGQSNHYTIEKLKDMPAAYPLEHERRLLQAIRDNDKVAARETLNLLLGYILFASGGAYQLINTRVHELLVLISRAAMEAGADPAETLELTHEFFCAATEVRGEENIDELCQRLAVVMSRLMESIFSQYGAKHAGVMYNADRYMRANYSKKITLEEVARQAGLSTSYFGKVFKAESGTNFTGYLNAIRVEKSKLLLAQKDLSLAQIAARVGFENQSYYTKMFKKHTGISPKKYRDYTLLGAS